MSSLSVNFEEIQTDRRCDRPTDKASIKDGFHCLKKFIRSMSCVTIFRNSWTSCNDTKDYPNIFQLNKIMKSILKVFENFLKFHQTN